MSEQRTLTDILGKARIEDLKKKALQSRWCGISLTDMSEDERLAAIGVIAERVDELTRSVADILRI